MALHLDFTDQATEDINNHKKAGNKAVLTKLYKLLNEVSEHPTTGTGKPEALKYSLSGLWARRINREHRLIYKINNVNVLILSAKGHYLKNQL